MVLCKLYKTITVKRLERDKYVRILSVFLSVVGLLMGELMEAVMLPIFLCTLCIYYKTFHCVIKEWRRAKKDKQYLNKKKNQGQHKSETIWG